MSRRKKPIESAELKDARARFRELEGYAAKWAEQGAPLHVMADCVAGLGLIAAEIAKLEGKAQ
jgi:hypothetical protein